VTLAQRLLLATAILTIAATATVGYGVREAWRTTEERRFQAEFRAALEPLRRELHAHCYRMLGSVHDAEDALQDVFVRAYAALRANDREVSLRAWLYRVAHNRCIDELRRPAPPPPETFELIRPPANDPIAEAEHFLAMVNAHPAKPGDLLVLDLEVTDGKSPEEVNAWAKAWLAHVRAKTGVKPMIYSGWAFADAYLKGLGEYPLWVAHYSKPKGAVTPPADWTSWVIHQYSETPIDQNVTALTADQLRALGRPGR